MEYDKLIIDNESKIIDYRNPTLYYIGHRNTYSQTLRDFSKPPLSLMTLAYFKTFIYHPCDLKSTLSSKYFQ